MMTNIDPKFGKPYDPRGKAGKVTAADVDDLVVEGDGQLSILIADPETQNIQFGEREVPDNEVTKLRARVKQLEEELAMYDRPVPEEME